MMAKYLEECKVFLLSPQKLTFEVENDRMSHQMEQY
jgi:hypothetical protein